MAFPRIIVENSVTYLAGRFPSVGVLGARQCGKTSLLRKLHSKSGGTFVDLESESDFKRVSHDPEFFLSSSEQPVYIDEAQQLPAIFPALRVAIDAERGKRGRYFLSGSSSPELQRNIDESLAGRIGIFELGTLTLEEVWQSNPSPLFECVARGETSRIIELPKRHSLDQVLQSFLLGGYPEPVWDALHENRRDTLWMDNYLRTYIHRDIRKLFPGLDIDAYRRFIQVLAHSSGSILNLSDIGRTLSVSQPTVSKYLDIASGTFVWRTVPAHVASARARMVKSPRGHLRDSGLLTTLHRVSTRDMLLGHPGAGRWWEAFVTEELLKGFSNRLVSVGYSYFRTKSGMQIDLILKGEFGTVPIEIKLGSSVSAKDLQWLSKLVAEMKLPYAMVINNAESPVWLTEKIVQFPITHL